MSESKSPRVLGEGSFGCVLKPEVKCAGPEKKIGKNAASQLTVSKVFDRKKYFRQEVAASKKIAKIDPKGTHILVPSSYCDTSYGVVSLHPAASECEVIQQLQFSPPSTKLYQIKMPYGGVRYDKFVKSNNLDLSTFVKQMTHVLEGVQKLHRKQVCHQDLKASNLLIASDGRVMIIDYSLMLPFSDVYSTHNVRRLRHTYFPYPPEYKVFYLVYNGLCAQKTCSAVVYEVMKNFDHYGSDRLQMMQTLHEDTPEFVATIYKYALKNKSRLMDAFSKFAGKVDVYSVGMIMLDLDKYISKTGASDQAIRTYYQAMAEMTMIDPQKRATVAKALKILKSIHV